MANKFNQRAGMAAVVLLAAQACVPAPPVHPPPLPSGGKSSVTSLPPSATVLITANSTAPAMPYPDQYDFTDCDSFLPAGVAAAPGTKPTLFQYHLEPDGTVRDASLYRSSGSDALDKAALECANTTHRQEVIIGGAPAQILWIGAVSWANAPHGFFEPRTDGLPAAMCKPEYPTEAISAHKDGGATVLFRIGTDGNPENDSIVESSGTASLDEAARRCVRQFRYFPASANEQPVRLDKTARIEFRIAS